MPFPTRFLVLIAVVVTSCFRSAAENPENSCDEKLENFFYVANVCQNTMAGSLDSLMNDIMANTKIMKDCDTMSIDRYFFMLPNARALEIREEVGEEYLQYRLFSIDQEGHVVDVPYMDLPQAVGLDSFQHAYYHKGHIVISARERLHVSNMTSSSAAGDFQSPRQDRIYDHKYSRFVHRHIGERTVESLYGDVSLIRDVDEDLFVQDESSVCNSYIPWQARIASISIARKDMDDDNLIKADDDNPQSTGTTETPQNHPCVPSLLDSPLTAIIFSIIVSLIIFSVYALIIVHRIKFRYPRLVEERHQLLRGKAAVKKKMANNTSLETTTPSSEDDETTSRSPVNSPSKVSKSNKKRRKSRSYPQKRSDNVKKRSRKRGDRRH
ncbi:hypothetical protein QR680_017784 [Steinernema hermaphroditum]|uniref:Receptor L-domain domain-containing protein n=1 Tax=Steinernema hermaphroditum TaxID=289476 RepID=A0AA39HFT1_9BILA|nr:hypothetical protein QR680_017784 [Steinernema hermaphroditum]